MSKIDNDAVKPIEYTKEELEEAQAEIEKKSKNEDLRADGYEEAMREEENNTYIAGEVTLEARITQKREEKKRSKEEKIEAKRRAKKIKKSKKYLKHHKVNIKRYDTDPENGLPTEVVNERELEGLTNTIVRKTSKSIGKIIFSNVFTFFNMLIFIIAAALITVGIMYNNIHTFTDLVFFLIVIVNTIIGIIQEINAKNMIDKLSLMSAPTAQVIRSGVEKEVTVDMVVLDDLLKLSSGDQICSDSIVVSGSIEVNESLLTGESNSILKNPGDQLYSGSFVVAGTCNARVDKIGADNYIEKLSSQARIYKKPKSDLLGSLNLMIKFMFIPIITIGTFLFIRMYFDSTVDIVTCIRKTAGAMVGMIPSGLFLMSSIAVTIGVIRLGQRNVLVQELYCIEMLARVNCICLDKTGTITDGTMSVKTVIDYNEVHGLATKNIVSAILNALPSENQTSHAMKEKFGLGKRMSHLGIIPFSSERKYSAVTFVKYGTFLMGAPEFVLKDQFKKYERDVNKYASLGYRVIAIAHQDGEILDNTLPSGDITLIAMILITDNIRPDAIETIKYFKESQVEVRVISGDNAVTVSKIAQRAGVPNAERYISLDGMTDEEVSRCALRYTVFGRVTPNQKKILVQQLKASGRTVAMTGDGVNDILALREADCSIAVASGSEAARNCSHLVLVDSNFGSMPFIVSEGRRVINNVTKVSTLFLTKTIFSLFLAVQGIIMGYYPISATQLFLIDTLCIGLPSLLLVWEPNNMPVKGRFLPNVIKRALPGALTILLISIIVFGLDVSLGMDNMVRTTIIVLAATHTCLMVEYKEFKPFNVARRIMFFACYGLFLFAILFLPQLFEFKPLTPISEYYSISAKTETWSEPTNIKVSEENHIVFNNEYLTGLDTSSIYDVEQLQLTATKQGDKYYYTVSGIVTNKEVVSSVSSEHKLALSFDIDGDIYLGGYRIKNTLSSYNSSFDLKIDTDGSLYYINQLEKKVKIQIELEYDSEYYNYVHPYGTSNSTDATNNSRYYSLLPTVTISGDQYKINGQTPQDGKYKVSSRLVNDLSKSGIEPSIGYDADGDYYYLLVNGEKIMKTYTDATKEATPYIINLPTVTRDTYGDFYLDGSDANLNVFSYLGEEVIIPITILNSDGLEEQKEFTGYSYTDIELNKDIIYVVDTDNELTSKFYTVSNEEVDGVIKQTSTPLDYQLVDFYSRGLEKSLGNLETFVVSARNVDQNKTTSSTYSVYYGSVSNIKATDVSYSGNIFSPSVKKSEAKKYVIEGYYTNYDAEETKTYTLSLTENNYLVINGTTTDYKVSSNYITTTTGGWVKMLNIQYFILLLMLCFMAPYTIKLFQQMIPSIVKFFISIKTLINKGALNDDINSQSKKDDEDDDEKIF